ncbi:hypothetical protein F5Y19DRAFT_95634 [Xylariaceae sp. FL1651]|nr:hypothetical protein F5Y19DRAFT_95634 [Xylariaceae sp. FL1651]
MRPTVVAFVLTGAVIAQDLGALPDCAKNCLAKFTTGDSIGDCSRLDAKCICSSSSFINGIACCLAGVCNAADQQSAVNYAVNFCDTQGVTNLPTSVTCVSSSATSTTAPASSTTAPPATTATPNFGVPVGLGSNANLCGGLLAALAML